MRVFSALLAIAAMSTFVGAAPYEHANVTLSTRDFPGCNHQWVDCGHCNGSSCKVHGVNRRCKTGTSCTKQAGAGDGAVCGTIEKNRDPLAKCPGVGNLD